MSRPKILFIPTSSDGNGGDVQFLKEFCSSNQFCSLFEAIFLVHECESYYQLEILLHKKCQARFIYYNANESKLADYVEPVSQRIGQRIRRRARIRYEAFGEMFRALEIEKPSLVWFNMGGIEYPPFDQGMKQCRELDIPYWHVCHNVTNELTFRPHRQQIASENLLKAKRVVINSLEGIKLTKRAIPTQSLQTSLLLTSRPDEMMDTAEQVAQSSKPRSNGTARFLHVGTYYPEHKGQHLLLSVLKLPVWQSRDWHLTLAGNGDASYLKNLTEIYGLNDRITFVGFRSEIMEIISESDVFIFPSLSEGKGMALVEALAAGRPALGTPIGGIPELIHDDQNGWLCSAASTHALEVAMERMWQDRPRWAEMGASGREDIVDTYRHSASFPRIVDDLVRDCS